MDLLNESPLPDEVVLRLVRLGMDAAGLNQDADVLVRFVGGPRVFHTRGIAYDCTRRCVRGKWRWGINGSCDIFAPIAAPPPWWLRDIMNWALEIWEILVHELHHLREYRDPDYGSPALPNSWRPGRGRPRYMNRPEEIRAMAVAERAVDTLPEHPDREDAILALAEEIEKLVERIANDPG